MTQHVVGRECLLHMVGIGYGISVVTEAASKMTYPDVVFRRIDEADAVVPITAAWLTENANPVLYRFLSLVRQHLASAATTPRL